MRDNEGIEYMDDPKYLDEIQIDFIDSCDDRFKFDSSDEDLGVTMDSVFDDEFFDLVSFSVVITIYYLYDYTTNLFFTHDKYFIFLLVQAPTPLLDTAPETAPTSVGPVLWVTLQETKAAAVPETAPTSVGPVLCVAVPETRAAAAPETAPTTLGRVLCVAD